MVNLVLAFAWLTAGIVLFVREHREVGYLALALFGYNLLRWWIWFMRRPGRQEPYDAGRRKEVVNPEFDFSKDADEGAAKDPRDK